MNIAILLGSPRKDGNTAKLVEAFKNGASKNNNVEIIAVSDYNVGACKGCNFCFQSNENLCVQNDDMQQIYAKLKKADMLVIASPVYFYSISSQLKTIIDRLHNPIRDSFNIKHLALLVVGASSSIPDLFAAIEKQYELCLNFFHLNDAGRILVRGMKTKDAILETDALNKAFELGESIK